MATYHFRGKALIDVEVKVQATSRREAISLIERMGTVSLTPPSERDPKDRPVLRPEMGGSTMLCGSVSKMWIVKEDDSRTS